jgi:hypothetical protein
MLKNRAGRGIRAGRVPVQAPIRRPQAVPAELAGRWVAWSADGMKILGQGATIPEARASAGRVAGLVLSWIPPLEELRPRCEALEANAT